MPDRRPDQRLGLYCHGDLITARHRAELAHLPGFRDWLFLPLATDLFVLWHRSVRPPGKGQR